MTDRSTPAPDATKRPGIVTAGIIILGLQAIGSLLIGIYALTVLGQAPAGTAGLAESQLLSGVLLASGVINGAALVFIWRGYGIARFIVLVVGGVVVVLDFVSGRPTLGDFLWILAIVLLFLPKSGAWFRAKAAQRAA
jgi:hypothetical protein